MDPEHVRFDTMGALQEGIVLMQRRAHRAVPLRWAHPLSVNARVVAWACVEAVLSAPVLAVLLGLYCIARTGDVLVALFDAVVTWVEWVHHHAGERAARHKRRAHNTEMNRRVREWVGRLCPVAEPVLGMGPSLADLRRGFDIGNGVCVRWRGGRSVVLKPGGHRAPLFDDQALHEAAAEAEASRVEHLESIGHTPHCACRIVWGDGECECAVRQEDAAWATHPAVQVDG